jgi:1-acyl-sn-glycerol-3-phosphate acyltransferase
MAASGDQRWARTPPARAAREALLCGVLGSIIAAYSRRTVTGRHRLVRLAGPAILVANHCSHVDTPVLLLSLPAAWRRRTAVAAAADYFYGSRLVAAAVSLAFGTVPLDRGQGAGADVPHIRRLLDAGWNLVVFAEGTRSRDGRVGRMRSGAAILSADHGVPIIPVHISGTHEAMPIGHRWMVRPQGGRRFARHTISVRFGAPIPAGAVEDRGEVMAAARMFMQSCGADLTPEPDRDTGPHAEAGEVRAPGTERVTAPS